MNSFGAAQAVRSASPHQPAGPGAPSPRPAVPALRANRPGSGLASETAQSGASGCAFQRRAPAQADAQPGSSRKHRLHVLLGLRFKFITQTQTLGRVPVISPKILRRMWRSAPAVLSLSPAPCLAGVWSREGGPRGRLFVCAPFFPHSRHSSARADLILGLKMTLARSSLGLFGFALSLSGISLH